MHRHGFLYTKICEIENIKKAMAKASLGKRNQKRIRKVLEHADVAAKNIREMLLRKTYVPSKPQIKTIQDRSSGKVRVIHKPNFYPDQIVHWALMLQLEPIIMRGMYEYNCGSVPRRGTSMGQKALNKWLRKDRRGTKYCLKMDIKKFYPSIDNRILKEKFRRKIKDPDVLWLIDRILFTDVGQPIGFYTSQWFANFFLQDFDHFVKEQLHIKYFIRYVDDLVMLGPNKRKLHRARKAISQYLHNHHLSVKSNWQVFRTSCRDIDFLGIRFFPDHMILRKRNALRIRRRVSRIRKKGYLNYTDACAVISYWGWLKRTNSYHFYHSVVKPVVGIKLARKVVSINVRHYPRRDFRAQLNRRRRLQAS